MAVLVIAETGKRIRVSAGGFDMSSNTSIQIRFSDPSGNTTDKTATLGTTAETFDVIGAVAANTWAYYDIDDATLFDEAGTWQARLLYANTGATPSDSFIGVQASFTVTA